MRTHVSLLSFAAVAAFSSILAVACGGSDDDTGPGAVSSVDSSKPVNSLTDAEMKQYCEDGQAYAAKAFDIDTKRFSCGYVSQYTAGLDAKDDAEAQSKCRTAFDECMKQPDTESDAGTTDDNGDDCATFAQEAKGCSATVGELNTCISDQTNAIKALASKDWCADAKAGGSNTGSPAFESPASCKAIQAKCPAFVGDNSDDGTTQGNATARDEQGG